jgi:hypothetical protein
MKQGGLARARWTNNADDFPFLNGNIHTFQDLNRVKSLKNIPGCQHVFELRQISATKQCPQSGALH